MSPLPRADRTLAVATAAAHDLNNELTIVLTSVSASLRALDPKHPARATLLDLRSAAQRCARTTSTLLNFTARRGARPSAVTAGRLADLDRQSDDTR